MKQLFLLAMCFAAAFSACTGTSETVTVSVENHGDIPRENEMAEVEWAVVKDKLSLQEGQSVVVTDAFSKQVPYQLVSEGSGETRKIIFPVTVAANGKAEFRIAKGQPETFRPMVYGRFVPERKDDFAWENNRSAFRLYGPALEAAGEISSGMDFWAKRTDSLVIDKWYRNDLAGIRSYHEDHGEGLDFYKVGRTLGLGMTAPYADDSLWLGNNFTEYKILDQGPLRISFELRYKPYMVQNTEVSETRVISLDAYSYFNKVEQTFTASTSQMNLATGIVVYGEESKITFAEPRAGIMAYEVPADSVNGTIYAGVIHPASFTETDLTSGHLLGISAYKPGEKFMYYAGGGWSKAGFADFAQWMDFLKEESRKIKNPVKINVR